MFLTTSFPVDPRPGERKVSLWTVKCRSGVAGSDGKELPAVWQTQVRSLNQGDPLKKGIATHSSILAWRIPWTEGLAGYSPWGRKESDMTQQLMLSLPGTGKRASAFNQDSLLNSCTDLLPQPVSFCLLPCQAQLSARERPGYTRKATEKGERSPARGACPAVRQVPTRCH